MKNIKLLFYECNCIFAFLVLFLLTACVNSISDDETPLPTEGTIPISFTGKVSRTASTRVSDKALEVGDKIGLMAMFSGTPLTGQRYIDNLQLECSDDNSLQPERLVYYPEGNDVNLDFVAYHPYQTAGLPHSNSKMTVTVMSDQRIKDNRTQSDFLVASKSNVAPSSKSVTLTFKHKLAKVKVELVPENKDDLDHLLTSNPMISACNFYTRAVYDFVGDSFSDVSAPEVIRMAGSWKKSTDKLVGMEMIVVPQEINPDEQYLVMELNGKLYTCSISAATLNSNTQRVITIRVKESVDHLLSGFIGEVEDWGEGTTQEEESEIAYQVQSVHTALLSFEKSNIYHLYHNGKIVAEVCKEYLRLPDAGIDSQALVLYEADNGTVNLKQGYVLELLDEEGKVHGGRISWDVASGKAQYTPGTADPIRTFYIDDQGKMAVVKPDAPLMLHLKNYYLQDMRGGTVTNYGVVKIGTQYWMRENLHATSYTNGEELILKSKIGTGAGYFQSKDVQHIFYNGEAIMEGELAPAGWLIPQVKDWDQLVEYVGEVAALKVGEWQCLEAGELAPVTNRSFFYAYPVGMCGPAYAGTGAIVGFHSMDVDGKTVAKQSLILVGEFSNYELQKSYSEKDKAYKGCSIRCLRK